MNTHPSRIAYLDNLRILVTSLVVFHHTIMTYTVPDSWYFHDTPILGVGQFLLTVFTALTSSFFMGFFFLLAGFFTPQSYDRKGPARFLRDRLLRLGIPIGFYVLVVYPFIRAMVTVRVADPGAAFWPTYGSALCDISFSPGPLWFVTALLIFSVAYVLVRITTSRFAEGKKREAQPLSNRKIVLLGLGIGIATFLLRIAYPNGKEWFVFRVGDFAQYVALFGAGVFAYRKKWFEKLTRKQGQQWLWAAIGIVFMLPVVGLLGNALDGDPSELLGGFGWPSFAFSLWWSMQGIAIIVALLINFREHLHHQGALARELARSTYTVYILHAPIVVGISLLLLSTGWHSAIKLPIACIASLVVCFSISTQIRRIPLSNRIL